MKDELAETVVNTELNTKWVGRPYHYLESVRSTNDLLKELAGGGKPDDPPHGTVLLADYQEKGRGRFGRTWEAPPYTSLLLSVLFRPDWHVSQLSWLTMLAGLSVAEVVEKELDLQVSLKWPNDVVLSHDGKWSKVCGILLETAMSTTERLEYAVLGIGLNVNIPVSELPPAAQPVTSLMVAAGHPISRFSLLLELLKSLECNYDAANRRESPYQRWNERLVTIGQRVEIHRTGQGETLVGTAELTDEWGQLLVRDDYGQLHTITAADVTLSGSR